MKMDYKLFLQLCSLAVLLVIADMFLGFETAIFHSVATFMIIAFIVIGAIDFFRRLKKKKEEQD